MRVLRLSQVPPAADAGRPDAYAHAGLFWTHLLPLSVALRARGVESTFFSPGGLRAPASEQVDGFGVRRTRMISFPFFVPYGLALLANWTPLERAVGGPIEIVHAHNPHYAHGLTWARLRAPLVVSVHGSFKVTPLERPLLERVFARAEAVIAINEPARKQSVELGAKPENVVVVHTGIDPTVFFPRAIPRETEILFVGRLVAWKGVDVLIRALGQLSKANPAWRLRIVGGGPERAALEELARSLGIADRVVFEGERAQSDLPSVYSRARVSVVPHRFDSFGKSVIESMACGTPVVGTDHDIPEKLAHVGRFYPVARADDPAALANALSDVIMREKWWQERAGEALEIVRTHFSWDAVAEANLRAYAHAQSVYGARQRKEKPVAQSDGQ